MLRCALSLCFLLTVFAIHRAAGQSSIDATYEQCMRSAEDGSYAGLLRPRICLDEYLRTTDTATAKAIIVRLEEDAQKHKALRIYAQFSYVHRVLGFRGAWPLDSMIGGLEGMVLTAERLGDEQHLAWAETQLAAGYFNISRQYDLAFETGQRAHRRIRAIPESRMPDRADMLGTIANFYYYFGEYRQAIGILTGAVSDDVSSSSPATVAGRRRCFNTLGLCYRGLGRYESSDLFFHKALREADLDGDAAWQSIIRGNIGINLYRQGHYAIALPLLSEDVRASTARADFDNAAGSLLPLADIALKFGHTAEAAAMLDTARRYISAHSAIARLPLYHSLRIQESAARGDVAAVAVYTDSLASIKDSLAHHYSALHLARAEQRLQSAGMRAKLAAASAQRNALVIILLLASGVTTFGFLYFRRRRIEAQQRASTESARAAAELRAREAELRAKESELATAEHALERFRYDVQEKATLIERLSAQLNEEEHGSVLQQLREATILTDAQWVEFRRMFEKVHAGFIERLGQQYAGLTAGEVRFLVLARLGFSNKEMASALGVSTNSVRVTWHRLRRKLKLDDEVQVGALVEGI